MTSSSPLRLLFQVEFQWFRPKNKIRGFSFYERCSMYMEQHDVKSRDNPFFCFHPEKTIRHLGPTDTFGWILIPRMIPKTPGSVFFLLIFLVSSPRWLDQSLFPMLITLEKRGVHESGVTRPQVGGRAPRCTPVRVWSRDRCNYPGKRPLRENLPSTRYSPSV